MISGFYRVLTFSNKEAKLNDIFKINSEFAPVLRFVYYLYKMKMKTNTLEM